MEPPHHEASRAAPIQVQGIPQAQAGQQLRSLQQSGTLVVDALQGEQPELTSVAADHGAGGPLAQESGAEALRGAIQHRSPAQQQQRPSPHHVGGHSHRRAGAALQAEGPPLRPGQAEASAAHQQGVARHQRQAGGQKVGSVAGPHHPIADQYRGLPVDQAAVGGAPVGRVATQPAPHIAAVEHRHRPAVAAGIEHRFLEAEAAETR